MGVVIFSNRTAKRILSLLHDQEGHGIVANPNDRHDSPYRARQVKPFLVCRGESPLQVKVLPGCWHRRDHVILLTEEVVVDVTATCYVAITLKSGGGENPSVCPDDVEIKTYTDWPTEEGGKQDDTILVLARVVVEDNKITAIEQRTVGDVNDWAELPDSENPQKTDGYKTLQWHDIPGQKETLGLYGINSVKYPHVAFGVYSAATDEKGELRWHYPDSDNGEMSVRHKSIQVENEENNRCVQLWGFRYGGTTE